MNRLFPVAGLVVVLVCAWSAAATAQTVSLTGRVADPQGGPIGDAAVTLGGSGGSAPKTTRAGVDGAFVFIDVPAGSYTLSVEAPGFQPGTQAIAVTGTTPTITMVLQIAGVTENIVVAAPKLEEELPQEIERGGARLQTITATQIENGGYYDVSQALQAMAPGLFLTPKAGAFDYVAASLQGSRTNEILWLVDGVRISNRLYNGTTPLDTLPAHMVERIEIIEGGEGLFYGTQAVAGVINVVTKSFTDNADGRVQAGADTNSGGHLSAFARDTLNGHRVVLYGSKDGATGFQSFPVSEYQPSTTDRERTYDVSTIGGKYAYDFSKDVRFSAMYQLSDVQLDTLRPARSSPSQPGGLSAAFNERVEQITSTKLDYTARENVQFFLKGYYHQWDSHYSERRNVINAPGTEAVISEREFWGYKDYGANVLARASPHRGVEYFGGYDFQNYSGRDEVLLIAPNTETVHAVFGEARTTRDVFGKATFGAGARYNAPTHSKSGAVWNVSGRYDFTSNLFARTTFGTSFRYPDAYELFAVDPTCCFGNADLKPETSRNVNGSFGGRVHAGAATLNLEVIGFARRVTDLIVDIDDGSGETTITANQPDVVDVHGLSLVASATATSAVSAALGYTYTRSQRTNELAGGYSALAGIPSNQVDASVDIHPAARPFGLTLTVNWVGEMFDTVNGFGSVPSGEYTVTDIAGRVFLDGSRRQRINVRLENLFDESYTTIHQRGFTDVSPAPYLVHNLGTPRTLHLSYGFSF